MSQSVVGKLRISILCPSLALGGAERLSVNLANQYAALGHQSELLVLQPGGVYADRVSPSVIVTCLEVKRARHVMWPLRRHIRATRPDVVISMLRETNLALGLAARFGLSPTKIVLREAAPLAARRGMFDVSRFLLVAGLKAAYRGATGLIANSDATLSSLVSAGVMPAALPRVVIGNPVLNEGFEGQVAELPEHPWCRDTTIQLVVGAGRLHPLKDFELLVRAFAIVSAAAPNARLLILGDGPERPRLEALVAALGLNDRVDMPGFVANPFGYFASAAVFVLSSQSEGFGNVIVEALAAGAPVISTDCGGPAEILAGGRFGTLVPVGDVRRLATAISDHLSSKAPVPGARSRAMEFTVPRTADSYLKFAERLLIAEVHG